MMLLPVLLVAPVVAPGDRPPYLESEYLDASDPYEKKVGELLLGAKPSAQCSMVMISDVAEEAVFIIPEHSGGDRIVASRIGEGNLVRAQR